MEAVTIAARLIRVLEGCRLTAYWDKTGKVWTVGFGHTSGVTKGMTITMEQAEKFLAEDMAPIKKLVKHLPKMQQVALISFGHNVGIDDVQRVLNGSLLVIPDGFYTKLDKKRFGVKSGGVVLEGLIARRRLEAALYLAA